MYLYILLQPLIIYTLVSSANFVHILAKSSENVTCIYHPKKQQCDFQSDFHN
jgi:hypothetical protein